MRFLVLNLVFLLAAIGSKAQQVHFVYLQTDNKQPFYVKLGQKIYSSSSTGYLVIPKLSAGTHNLAVGFPKNEWPLQNLTVSIADKDLGFALKNFESKGWALFNFHTMEVINATSPGLNTAAQTSEPKKDEFSNVLADVVNTPSIKEQEKKEPPVAKVEEVKTETASIVIEPKADISADANTIERISSVNDADGIMMVYKDMQATGTDTIRIFIPVEPQAKEAKIPASPPADAVAPVASVKETPAKLEEKKGDPKFIDIDMANPNANSGTEKPARELVQPASPSNQATEPLATSAPKMINSDCRQIATEEDFMKTRKKMSAEKNDENMVNAAKKAFKQKCYSTEQVKNLSVLFLTDEGKYKLFDAAYPFVHDTPQFKELQFQLADPYVITRFKAMLRN